jgi:hypothetical protein
MIDVILNDSARTQEWKAALEESKDFLKITKDTMWGDYLHEIHVIQEVNGELPKEFEGLQ